MQSSLRVYLIGDVGIEEELDLLLMACRKLRKRPDTQRRALTPRPCFPAGVHHR